MQGESLKYMKIVLIGFACSYKTSAGKYLAQKLNYKVIDTDSVVENVAGKSIADIFATEGEAGFREREGQTLLSLSYCDNVVISCGGGSPLNAAFGKLASDSTVVWLTSTAQTVQQRLGQTARPLFDGKSVEQLDKLIIAREPCYAKYANVTVATDGKTSQQVADEIFCLL